MSLNRLGIIAGGGELPFIALQEAIQMGEDPILLGLRESDFDPNIEPKRTIQVHLTKIGEILKICKKQKINRILLTGKVRKELLFKGLKFDLKAISILAKTINKNDHPLFLAVAEEFTKYGIEFESQKKFLSSLLLEQGRYTKSKLSTNEMNDIEFGMDYASKMANLDVGQSVVVLDRSVVAVEAAEGTDETIRRGGFYTAKKGTAIVCKSSKRNQDPRFDLPTIGIHTLQTMLEAKCKTLAFREGETIVVRPQDTIAFAEKNKLNLVCYGTKGKKAINEYKKIR
ncbi:LpxI family protein [Leptospira sp. GIMC2001]|uniref:LpxI family protein n=1 Tax=Leptospira sp. GIMC2001 TaxID=1513297 RepID=UPI00234B76CA|nr:UDP-2,3-diacylglucosamine diphosphatase LpxI [Leptospira sp. GIMC2001]WCL51176.1 UDP-2,3-diacylglucosamine diphosphatase LpxI [Leptospira sp. GIMC2001]